MEEGAKLTFNSCDSIVLVSSIKYGIYGVSSNIVNLNRCYIYNDALGIINVENLIVNEGGFIDQKESDNSLIKVSNSITIKKGYFLLYGEGIKAGKNIYINQQGENTENIAFQCLSKSGIEAEEININYGFYLINSLKEIFKAEKDITIQNANFELYSCSEKFPVQPIVSGGALKISNSNIFIAIYTCVKELPDQKETIAYSGKLSKDQIIYISSDQGVIGSRKIERELNYIYYSVQQTGLKIQIDNKDVEKTDPKLCQTNDLDSSEEGISKQNGNQKNISKTIKIGYILIFISLILLN